MEERSRHQKKIIHNYYENRESIALQKLQELVTELYLSQAAGGKSRQQQWKRVATHLQKLGLPQSQIDHLLSQDSAELLADQVNRLAK